MFNMESDEHTHTDSGGDFWVDYLNLLTDPAHWLFEITVTLVVDVFIGYLIVKKFVIPRIKRSLHKEIDAEHGYPEHD